MIWSDLKLRLRALLFRRRAECDLDDELKFHLAMETRKNREAGMDVADARRNAVIQFGGLAQVKEECRDVGGLRFPEALMGAAVARLVLSQSMRFALIGAVLGAAAAFATIRVSASQMDLPMFGSFDRMAFAMGLALVIAAAAIAAWLPSRRAASIEPVTTLRCD
jgi:macrolide transport system ATP-binding/permease protein